MPRENRKRGKKHKHKKTFNEDMQDAAPQASGELEEDDAPSTSWIVPARDKSAIDENAPFGYVDAEVKAYFRTVDVQIREWQEARPEVEVDEDIDPNEDRRLFFVAALTEMSEKEKQLATDPDCSTILERMIYSMDDFVRRVFMDSLSGSLEQLSKHRFASHVCQTLLTVANGTVTRESRGILPSPPESQNDVGELRTFTQLTLDICKELIPSLSQLIVDPFASHVIRALVMLLGSDVLNTGDAGGASSSALRSKKSAAYKARQGSMKSVFRENDENGPSGTARHVPKEFREAASNLVATLREQLNENEVRALAANQVASPVLQMFLELEAAHGEADVPGSLMDRVLVGLVSAVHENSDSEIPESDYLITLLRDPTASYLLETLVRYSPDRVFGILWQTYFFGKLSRLAVHPVANFVVAKAFERLGTEQLAPATQELRGVAAKIVKHARTGVLKSLVDRTSVTQVGGQDVVELILTAFELETENSRQLLVPCVLRLKSPSEYQRAVAAASEEKKEEVREEPLHKRRKTEDPLEPKIQGALLLQSMLRLPSPHNEAVLDSIQSMSLDELIQMAHHPTSSRVLDAVLESSTVPTKAKRKFVLSFLGHFHVLVEDRIGSRVGDRCWASADPYLKEKIARSLIPHEHALAGSFYGKFFARNMNLHGLQRDPERWKSMQVASKNAAVENSSTSTPSQTVGRPVPTRRPDAVAVHDTPRKGKHGDQAKGKRKAQPQDEIDALFDATLGKKVKKAELAGHHEGKDKDAAVESGPKNKVAESAEKVKKSKKKRDRKESGPDKDLDDVLGAIRSAPKDDKALKKRKRAH